MYGLNRFWFLLVGLFCLMNQAHAEGVIIEFSVLDDPVSMPFSPWAMVILTLLLGVVTHRIAGRNTRSGPFYLLAIILGLVWVSSDGLFTIATAAESVTSIELTLPSPMTSPELPNLQDISVTNRTGHYIRIDSIDTTVREFLGVVPPAFHLPACEVGVILAPNEACYFQIGGVAT